MVICICELDKIDCKILCILQVEGCIFFIELGEWVGLLIILCIECVCCLECEGVIIGYYVYFDLVVVKVSLLVFVEISLVYKFGDIFEEFCCVVLKLFNVLECYLVLGDFDYLLKVWISEMVFYCKLFGSMLLILLYVCELKSYIVMEEVKEMLSLLILD